MSNRFDDQLEAHALPRLQARGVTTLQVNLGKLCNQSCRHCHVDAGPHQTGGGVNMGATVLDEVIGVIESGAVASLDITGGAPELNPGFRRLVEAARRSGIRVVDRCNLSVLFEPGQEDLVEFLAAQEVEVVASLPYYRRERTDRQRGVGVFDKSIDGLLRLNARGYGDGESGLVVNLVYNPVGAYLAGAQGQLEADFKRGLWQSFGVVFDRLFCITNMPVARFLEWLERSGNYESYMERLLAAFNPRAAGEVMCRDLVSVGPDGRIYDCDFNQMLALPVNGGSPRHIGEFDAGRLVGRRIVTGDHCLGCTAGAGSSCGGEVV